MTEQKRRNTKQWFLSLSMSLRIVLSVGILIFCSNFVILALVCGAAVDSVRTQMEQQMDDQLSLTLTTASNELCDLGELMVSMTTDTDIADFVTSNKGSSKDYLQTLNSVNENLRILRKTNAIIDYVALLRLDGVEPHYIGREMKRGRIYEVLLENAASAARLTSDGVSMKVNTELYDEPELNLYCPVFEKNTLNHQAVAYLIVGLNCRKLYNNYCGDNSDHEIRILNRDGTILVAGAEEEIGTISGEADRYREENGNFVSGDREIFYRKSKQSNLMVAVSTMRSEGTDTIGTSGKNLMFAIIIFTMLAIVFIYRICHHFYEPMREMLEIMHKVGEGDLEQHMKPYEQSDFRQISDTFNSMTTSLKDQMNTIRNKEKENTEIRLNALQSQIKPHFLYNTLECIHWQALMEGAVGASDMVMALSRYYRLGLSKGAEIVSLETELEHTRSYIQLQNIRFDNILEMEYEIEEEAQKMEIPKITLQPLVENAIYHGIKPLEDKKGHVAIRAHVEDGWLQILVSDDGIGMSDEQLEQLNRNIGVLINDGSYGVKNVHTRLQIRYGEGSGLHYEKNETGGITVTVRLPARKVTGSGNV